MIIIRGTTPTLTFTLPVSDLTSADAVYLMLMTDDRTLELSTHANDPLSITATTVSVTLTQKQTLAMHTGLCKIKINWTYEGGSRVCSDYAIAQVYDNKPSRELPS